MRMPMTNDLRELVAIGDLHLTDTFGKGGLAAYIKDHDKMVVDLVMSQPLKWARANGVKDVVLLGDICDGTRMSYEAQLQLLRLFRTPFRFHVILGNHDMVAEDPSMGHSLQIIKEFALPNVMIYEQPTVVGKVRFCPWPVQDFDKRYLNIAHIDVQGSRTDSGRLNKSEKLNHSSADAVIGHIHTAQRVRNSVFPGTLYQSNFGEGHEKFFAHCVYDDAWETTLVPVKPTYRLHTLEVSSKKDLKVKAGPRDLFKIILKDNANITAAHYKNLNVVKIRTTRSDAELALARIEDLSDGSEIELSTEEFIEAALTAKATEKELKRALQVRKQLLGGK